MADEWDHEDDALYWHGVTELERWYAKFFAKEFSQVRAGSGDTLMDLQALRDRLQEEGLEKVGDPGGGSEPETPTTP
jgi:hypothetical protein